MVAVAQVEHLFQPQYPGQRLDLALVAQDRLAEAGRWPAFLIVAGLDEIARVSLGDELGEGAGAKERDIIRVAPNAA